MADYEPIDLSRHFNAGSPALAAPHRLGRQLLRGLPFRLSDDVLRYCIRPASAPTPVRVTIGRPARYVIIAHRQLDASWAGMSAVGRHVADYVFRLAGGREVTVPIRQRFEIDVVPAAWGFVPFLAVPDGDDRLHPRLVGRFDEAGQRQCESMQGVAEDYYLWAWENPDPERRIEAIDLVARGEQACVIGAVTLGRHDEHPFVRRPRRPVVIDLDADPTGLRLEIDRGVAGFVQPIPDPDAGGGEVGGWGQWSGERSYAEVSALPSARLAVAVGGEELGSVALSDLESGQPVPLGPARVRLADSGRNWVHVTVLDAATQRPLPCRVHFRSPLGVPFQPHGHHAHVNSNLRSWHIDVGGDVRLGDLTFACIDGTCQGWLPRGEVVVEAARGFEYTPRREVVRIEPGQRELTIELSRWIDMAGLGWYSGDSHVHFLSTEGAHLEQQSEDLRVVNLLQAQWGSLYTNTEDFTGRVSSAAGGGYLVYVGQENRQHLLGHLILWGLQKPVMPWSSDGPSEAELGGSLESTLAAWADEAHAQGGTVVIPHFPLPNGEPAVLAATGRADAVESLAWSQQMEEAYYAYLNCGYRLPLVGGTDKMTSDVPVGLYRTYARVEGELSYESWCAAVRAGRTFLSGGPILHLAVDGHEIGDTFELRAPGSVQVETWADGIFPLARLEIVLNGRVVAAADNVRGELRRLGLSEPLRVGGHCWIAARCYGAGAHLDGWRRPVYAHTSPVYVAVGGEWAARDGAAARYLITLVEGGLEYVRHHASYYPDEMVTHRHGGHHRHFIEAPFHEALAALRARYPDGRAT
jgi:hypothetical protein